MRCPFCPVTDALSDPHVLIGSSVIVMHMIGKNSAAKRFLYRRNIHLAHKRMAGIQKAQEIRQLLENIQKICLQEQWRNPRRTIDVFNDQCDIGCFASFLESSNAFQCNRSSLCCFLRC